MIFSNKEKENGFCGKRYGVGFEDAVLQVLMGIRRGEMQTIRYMALKGRLRSWLRNHTHTHTHTHTHCCRQGYWGFDR